MESNINYSQMPEEAERNIKLKNAGNPALQKLRENSILKGTGHIFGLLLPLASLIGLSFFTFGKYSLSSDQNECFSVEYPNLK